MKITRKETQEVEYYDKTLCDKCGEELKEGQFSAFECSFIYKEGSIYPEGGSGTQHTMDLCPKCGIELMSVLTSLGYRINNEEWDF